MVYFLCLCLSLLLNLATPTFPSRPPAPLLSGAGQYFITVSIELDPYDYLKHNNVSHKINAYELQMEQEQQSTQHSINGFRGIFQDVLFKIVPSNETHQSATVFSLTPAVGYRFRIRALNSFGSSPWSSPSEMFKTRETVPSAPKNLTILNTDINSAELSWDAADTQDSNGNKHFRNYPSSYHVQYRPSIFSTTNQQHNKQNQTIWINHHSEISAILKLPVLEVQQITTLVDDNDSISSGLFWIKLKVSNREIKKKYAAKLESYISAGISHNASSDEFKLAMVNIKGIQIKRVSRYEPGSYGSSIHSKRGAYAWRVEFKMPNEKFQNDRAFIPLMEIYKDTINGKYSGGNIRAEIRRLERGQSPIVKTSSNTLKIEGLQNYSYYDFRVRGKNYYGFSPWSGVLLEVQTLPLLPKYPSKVPTSQQLHSKFVKQIEGRGRLAGNEFDPDYIPRTAIGGLNEENGSNGLAVIISSGAGQTTPSRTYFYCTGASQMYVVPTGSGFEIDSSVTDRFITIKLWGAGGAGGTGEVITPRQSFNLSSMKESLSNGGGGGFVESRISVSADEILTVQVGCGGKFYNSRNKSVEDHGGYPGGGKGGISVMGQGTGSGGGHSSILQSGTVIIAAGGGGGGGSTDYCCAHGGVGGGTSGGNGSSPITPNTAKTVSKNYFEPIGCKSSSCYKRQYKENIAANVDYGFAPNASYDRPATEGNGGNFLNPGFGGYSGNYVVMENLISSIALSGSYGFGGNGADGKEGGGGGGSGFFGGGGGGSGVDGTGGGGGSGYVDFTFIYVPERRGHGKIGPDQPQVPEVTAISHNTFSLSWRNPSIQNVGYTAGFDTKRFDIELSQGREGSGMEGGKCSEDFKLVNTIQIDHLEITMNATITGLQPDTIYCARLISISDQGRSERGDAIEIITTLLPEHKWNQISPRKNLLTLQNVKLASEYNLCQRNPTPAIPPPRRGHSLSSIHGNLYLFGGITEVCICVEDSCSFNTVFSNELWKYEITTKIWKRLQSHSSSLSIPQGREEHSATVLSNGKLLIVGGKTSKSKNYEASEDVLFLGDVWEMDIGQVTHHTVSGSYSNDLPTSLGNSDAFYHTKKVSISPEPASRQGELCLKSLVVQISLEHACAQQIEYISIFGPKSRSSMKDFPANRQEEAKLFVRSQISISENECDAVISNITFSDTATNNILDNSYVLPSSGIFLPAEDLASHFSQQVNGEWTLVIYDNVNDNIVGMLVDWNIHFEVDYCFEGLQWTKLSNGSNACETSTLIEGKGTPNDCMNVTDKSRKKIEKFTPRYLHTSVAVKNTIYVMGGFFHGIVKESWRFDYFSKLWTQLHHSRSEKPHWYGQYATLTRWGYMVMYGGKRNHFESSYLERNIWLFKISDGTRTFVKANFSESPKSRYLSAISYIELVEENLTIQNNIFRDIEPLLVMFGGDMDLPNNNFLGDMWSLLLQESRIEKDTICESLLNSFSDDYNKWEWSCGAYSDINSSKPCQWEDVVTMAWCQGEYFQSFYSPL